MVEDPLERIRRENREFGLANHRHNLELEQRRMEAAAEAREAQRRRAEHAEKMAELEAIRRLLEKVEGKSSS